MKSNSLNVALKVQQLSVADKINKGRSIVNAITANYTVFESPNPDMDTVSAAIDDLEKAWNDAQDGGKSKTKLMHDKEANLVKILNNVAAYVVLVADGDESIVHLAGMDVKKKAPGASTGFRVEHGADSGTVLVKAKAFLNTVYTYQYSADAGVTWTEAGKTMISKFLIEGLTPGIKYYFRVGTFDRKGDHGFTESLSIIAL